MVEDALAWPARACAVAALLIGLLLGPWMAALWHYGGGGRFEDVPEPGRTIGSWLLEHGYLTNESGEPLHAWREGPGRGFFLVPLLMLPALWFWRPTSGPPATRAERRAWAVCFYAVAISTLPLLTEYWFDGIGFPVDVLAVLVGLGASWAWGWLLLKGGFRTAGLTLLASLPLTVMSMFYVTGYVPPGLLLGLAGSCAVLTFLSPEHDRAPELSRGD